MVLAAKPLFSKFFPNKVYKIPSVPVKNPLKLPQIEVIFSHSSLIFPTFSGMLEPIKGKESSLIIFFLLASSLPSRYKSNFNS